ncbi:MAG: hypothetical protein PHF31_09625 [Methylobacter sp.]|nr:hypothetical protein [Methylobacter sp.]
MDSFYINALMLATGSKGNAPKWAQPAVDAFAGFDSEQPITKQVKLLLIRESTKHFK